jgi:predicted ATP-dependent endonuclease of OLD family
MDVKKRRDEIKKIIEEKGIHSINKSDLARRFNVTHTQIIRDIRMIMGELPQVNWVSIFKEATQDFDRTLSIANKAMDNTRDNRLKARLAGQISEMLLRKMSFLEKMERLLPVGAKPEPVTIRYKCVDNTIFSPEDEPDDENVSQGEGELL